MYDETEEHYRCSLYHVMFFRDFVRRTGITKEQFEELGWVFGYSPDGQDEYLYRNQLDTIFKVIAPTLMSDVYIYTPHDEEGWGALRDFDTEDFIEPDDVRFPLYCESVLSLQFAGDEREIAKWRHFIKWLKPDARFAIDTSVETPHFLWLLNEYGLAETMDTWELLLRAWEVMEFYDNVSRGDAWRRLRGEDSVRTIPEQTAAA